MRSRKNRRGFSLLAVILLIVIMMAAAALALDELVGSIANGGRIRATEIIKSGIDHGLNIAVAKVQEEDPVALLDPPDQYDIFAGAVPVSAGREYVGPLSFPETGPYAGEFRVRVGIVPGQVTRATTGEDVRTAYGQVVELQISVEATNTAIPPVEERASVGVLVPRQSSHSN